MSGTPRSSTEEQAPYKGEAPGSTPGGARDPGEKVYCKDCLWCGANSISERAVLSSSNAICGAPGVRLDTFFEQVSPDPRMLNFSNNCPYFKRREQMVVAPLVKCTHPFYISAEECRKRMGNSWFKFRSHRWRVETCSICGDKVHDLNLYENVSY